MGLSQEWQNLNKARYISSVLGGDASSLQKSLAYEQTVLPAQQEKERMIDQLVEDRILKAEIAALDREKYKAELRQKMYEDSRQT